MLQVGDKIHIIYMYSEPQYTGKEGVITKIGTDPWGDTYYMGTWGGCNVYPHLDIIELVEGEKNEKV